MHIRSASPHVWRADVSHIGLAPTTKMLTLLTLFLSSQPDIREEVVL